MIEIALEISLIVLFLHACTWKDMIFSGIKKIINPEISIAKPIYGCPICMTPYWGTLIYAIFVFGGFAHELTSVVGRIREWILTIFTASGFSVLWVIAIYIKDYCKSRTRSEENCC